jgi:hypothetical protein
MRILSSIPLLFSFCVLSNAQSSLDAPGEKKITVATEIKRGLHEIHNYNPDDTDISLLQMAVAMNRVISRNRSANSDSDGFLLGACLGELEQEDRLLKLVESDSKFSQFNTASQVSEAKEDLKRYAGEIRAVEKKLAITDDQLVQAADPDPSDQAYRAALKALLARYSK